MGEGSSPAAVLTRCLWKKRDGENFKAYALNDAVKGCYPHSKSQVTEHREV